MWKTVDSSLAFTNSHYAENMNVVLLPVRWERDAVPTYRESGPQDIINEQLVNKCDILIGVFWTKMGTPTLRHSSGTLEEIDIFIQNNKEVMMYFVDKEITNIEEIVTSERPFIQFKSDSDYYQEIQQWWQNQFQSNPRHQIVVDQIETCKQMALNGIGYAILPSITLDEEEDIHKIPL